MSKIFISYSRKDEDWKNRLQEQLEVLALDDHFSVWEDSQITPGDNWLAEIKRELNQAKVAVMLISASFLTSPFIRAKEIPILVQRREQDGMQLIPLIVKPCAWQYVPWLSAIQGSSKDNLALSGLSEHNQDKELADLTIRIKGMLDSTPTSRPLTAQSIILSERLPTIRGKSFSRQATHKRFRIALSFPGERRRYVEQLAETLSKGLAKDKIFYDAWYQAELARPSLDIYLQNIYHNDAELVVVFLCQEYEDKEWCGLEWRAIRDLIKNRKNEDIMLMRFDDANITGIFSIDGYIDLSQHSMEQTAQFILQRIGINYPTDNVGVNTNIISDRLPIVKGKFFGREKELQLLDNAWRDEQTNIVEFVASGGTGKTKLLRHWLDRSLADKAMGINALIAWSFYSQGASEDKQIASSYFFDHAFNKLNAPSKKFVTEEARGEYLAALLSQHRCLLILDGLEPLQHASAANRGELKDRALCQMLKTLALNNQGLCVITTRIAVYELSDHQRQVVHHNLDNLQADDAIELLKNLQVHGSDKDLYEASEEYGYHALSISLLGNLLHRRHGGDIRKRDLIPELFDSKGLDSDSYHAFKIIQAYERWFGSEEQYSAELALLRLLGLFDHPIELSVLEVLQREQIPQLTQGINPNAWHNAIAALRDDHDLLAQANNLRDDQLDCHPLIRAYFSRRLQSSAPEAWRAAHTKLYDYYKNLPSKEQPDTLEEMQPLFRAVAHGCAAGIHQQALREVYWPRIQRSGEYYLPRKLGAFSDDLTTLAHFFTTPWHTPAVELTATDQALALDFAGFSLRALGRLREAQQPMQTSEDMRVQQKNWQGAATGANNLSELQLTLGEVAAAVASAARSVDYADRSDNLFQRMGSRTTHANALHQYGEQNAALALLHEAEALQQQHQPEYPQLYSHAGFHYCNVLLTMGESQQVLQRAQQTLIWAKQAGGSLLDIALDHLSLGRAHLQQQQLASAQQHLNQAVEDLRASGAQHHLPRGLLARAELYRQQGDYKEAEKDLQEVIEIAERGEMRLFLCDYHLAMTKLLRTRTDQALDQNQTAITHHLQTAKKIIHQTHYHRRLPQLNQLLTT